jgi:pimeloyl-ACP methyl ester carboxylesterase
MKRTGRAVLEVRDEGRGAPLLLLHGFPTSNRLWDGVLPALVQAGFRCIAPDLAGYGLSDAPPDGEVGMERQSALLIELLDGLGIDRPVVVAHDVGSAAAEILLADAPKRLRGLVVIDGVYADQWAMEFLESIQHWEPRNAGRLAPVLARRLRTPGGPPEEAIRAVLSAYEGESGGMCLIRAARALNPAQTASRLDAMRAAHVPARVIWGESDRYLPVDTVARPLADLLDAELRLLPGGHFLPLEAPEAVARELLDFVKRL